ncbi:VOC family protein [uncultured Shewanella sp.]|uniref:VOC family protein n=1 Tax=uncultured Shewanella sp. TaxID=173975 RepID=UPI002607AE7F|nr:VOC family protein [uncultured Shewanella sp.]
MYSHVMLGAKNIHQSKAFYDATFATLGYEAGVFDEKGRCFYFTRSGVFAITLPIDGDTASHGNGSTIGFSAQSVACVEAWHKAGVAHGGKECELPPGVREGSVGKMYIAYLRDPAGNKICALNWINE